MPNLTTKEREMIRRGVDKALVRPVDQWLEILSTLTPHEAAARIFGDLHLYRADQKIKGGVGYERRDGFLGDVQQLANALIAAGQLRIEMMSLTDLDDALASFP